jgi:hypothetical protein
MIRSFGQPPPRGPFRSSSETRGEVVEGPPGSLEQRDLALAFGVGHQIVLRFGRPTRDAVIVGHPDRLEFLDHLGLGGTAELGTEPG